MTTGMGSAQKAIGLMGVAEDLAAAKGISLQDAALAVTKASEGQLRPLKQLGIDLPIATGGALKTKTAYEALGKAQDKMKATMLAMHSGLLKGPAAMKAYQGAQAGLQTAQQKFNDVSSSGSSIIAALGQKLSGSAAAQADTFGGKVKAMKAELEDTGIKIGMALMPVLSNLASFLLDKLIPAISNVVGWVEKNWPKLMTAIMPVIDKIKGYITGFVNTVTAAWQIFGGRILSFATEAWDHVKTYIQGALEGIQSLFRFFADLFTGKWGKLWGDLLGVFKGIWKMLSAQIGLAWDAVKSVVSLAWDGIKQAVVAGATHVVNFMAELPGKILGAIGDITSKMFQVGVAIVEGIINGIGDIGSTLLHKVTSGLGGLVHGVKSFLGIASPSRVFYEIGSNTMQGFVLGMGDQQTWAIAAAKTTLAKVISTIQGGQAAVRSAMDAIGAGGRTVAGGKLDIQDAQRNLAQAKNDLPTYGFAVTDAQAQLDADKAAGASAETLQKDEIALADARLNLSQGSEAVKRAELALADARATEKSNVQSLTAAHGALASKMKDLRDIFAFLSKEGIGHTTTSGTGWGAKLPLATTAHTTNVNVHLHGTNIGTSAEFQQAVMRALRQAGVTKNMASNYGQQVQFT